MSYTSQRKSSGFSLIELLITLGILIITLTIALPGFREFFDRERLINATEEVYGMLQKARMESMARSDEMYVKFASSNGSWAYGLAEVEPCDPTIEDPTLKFACVITVDDGDQIAVEDLSDPTEADKEKQEDRVFVRFTKDSHPEISLDLDESTEIIENTETIFEFNPIRGTVDAITGSTSITLVSALDKRLRVTVSPLGNVGICSPNGEIPSYKDC